MHAIAETPEPAPPPPLPKSSFVTPTPPPPRSPFASLMHEWFVKYDPTYLFSAALVLGGLTLVSRDLAESGALGSVGVTLIAEVYALALIASAALLRRMGERRVAVMVGLLAALYQCDLTMHVETCAYVSGLGAILATAWAVLFAVKLELLCRALQLRPSLSARWVPTVGALALALLPQAFRSLAPNERTLVLSAVVFAVGALALWSRRDVESAVGFDYRGRRAIRGVWMMWACGGMLHVAYWASTFGLQLAALLPVVLLLGTRLVSRERNVWGLAVLALVTSTWPTGASVWVTALMVAITLVLRAFRTPTMLEVPTPPPSVAPPYRGFDEVVAIEPPKPTFVLAFASAEPDAVIRLLLGSASSLHLALWSMTARGGFWSAHDAPLDVVLIGIALVTLWQTRRGVALVPIAVIALHLFVERGWLVRPATPGALGVWSIALGFVSLAGGVGVRWRAVTKRGETRAMEPAGASAAGVDQALS